MFKIMNHQSSPRMNNINNLDTKEAILCEADDIYDSDPGYLTDGSSQLHGNTDTDHSLMSATKGNSTEEDTERKRVTANSQERCRMQRLNHALDSLRRCLPHQLQVCHRRLSKIRTLKLAANYISTLAEILNEHCASKYRLAQRRVLGMDPRFVNRTDVHRKDADVFRSGKHQHMSRSSESQRRTPAACQYAYHDGVSGASETTDIGSPDLSTTLQHHPVSVYHEMVNERQSIPYYNVSKDGFGQVFGHPTSPWYHKGVLVTGSSSAAIQQL